MLPKQDLLFWEEEDGESSISCLCMMICKQGLKIKKNIFVTGLKNTVGFLEIARDALRKRNTLIINRHMGGICWNFFIAVLIKMCFFRKSASRKLETKYFDILESFVLALHLVTIKVLNSCLFKVRNHYFS